MKIIGKTDAGLLLSASADEVANLVGYYSKYSDGVAKLIQPGCEILVADMFKQLYDMKSLEKELNEAAAKLRICADTITLTAPLIAEVSAKPEATL